MIRTDKVKLTVIKAEAYRQKLTGGDTGIVITRYDTKQPGLATISRSTGKAVPAANTSLKLFPQEAFDEAVALTARMPFQKARQAPAKAKPAAEEPAADPKLEETAGSEAYLKIVTKYTDKSGKLSYDLLNKDFIKFAHSSSIVRDMIAEGESAAAIRKYIAGVKFRDIADDHDLSDDEIQRIIKLLDDASPKNVFKELNDMLRKQLGAQKKK